jgi:hypothetical protein
LQLVAPNFAFSRCPVGAESLLQRVLRTRGALIALYRFLELPDTSRLWLAVVSRVDVIFRSPSSQTAGRPSGVPDLELGSTFRVPVVRLHADVPEYDTGPMESVCA